MKTQKLQFALTSLHDLKKKKTTTNNNNNKKRPTVVIKANKKMLMQISNPLNFLPNI